MNAGIEIWSDAWSAEYKRITGHPIHLSLTFYSRNITQRWQFNANPQCFSKVGFSFGADSLSELMDKAAAYLGRLKEGIPA